MISSSPLRMVAFACAAGLAGVACAGSSSGDGSSAPAPAVESTPDAPDTASVDASTDTADGAVVPALLQFSAPLVGGGEIVGDELAGKPTAFWFWSPT